jgi:nitroreductase
MAVCNSANGEPWVAIFSRPAVQQRVIVLNKEPIMEALEAIAKRRSIRKYKAGDVSKEMLSKLVDAGRLAPTGNNEQPWEFVVITEKEKLRRMADLAEYGKFIRDVPACIVVLCLPSRHYVEDGSAATTQILLAATALGLGACWVAGHGKAYGEQIVALCGAPAEYKLISMIAVGQIAEIPSPSKRSLDEVLHWETFRHAK